MRLDEFIEAIGAILYGKERFFKQDDGKWYDRDKGDYVGESEILKRIYDGCERERG